jgi:hypothetical protein
VKDFAFTSVACGCESLTLPKVCCVKIYLKFKNKRHSVSMLYVSFALLRSLWMLAKVRLHVRLRADARYRELWFTEDIFQDGGAGFSLVTVVTELCVPLKVMAQEE